MSRPEQLSSQEADQLLQTIEMFEVITQSNPRDCPSLEILKEAYWKIGKEKEALDVMRRLADAQLSLGNYSSALLEYQEILKEGPGNPEIEQLITEVESKLKEPTQPTMLQQIDTSYEVDLDPNLIKTNFTRDDLQDRRGLNFENDGNDALAKFLIQHKLAPEEVVNSALESVAKTNKNLDGEALAASLIDEVAKTGSFEVESLLCGILDRTKFAYIPLEYYDVDRQIVRMLPENLTLGRLIVPFDLISRTVMIAMANPFDAPGKEAVQQLFDYHVQWHLASPAAIAKTLRDAYRLDARIS